MHEQILPRLRVACVELGSSDGSTHVRAGADVPLLSVGIVEDAANDLAKHMMRRIRRLMSHFDLDCMTIVLCSDDMKVMPKAKPVAHSPFPRVFNVEATAV